MGEPVRGGPLDHQSHDSARQRAPHGDRRAADRERLRPRIQPALAAARVRTVQHDAQLSLARVVRAIEVRRLAPAGPGQHERDRRPHRTGLSRLEQGLGRDRGALRRHPHRRGSADRPPRVDDRRRTGALDRMRQPREPRHGARRDARTRGRRPRVTRRGARATHSPVPDRKCPALALRRRPWHRGRLRRDALAATLGASVFVRPRGPYRHGHARAFSLRWPFQC